MATEVVTSAHTQSHDTHIQSRGAHTQSRGSSRISSSVSARTTSSFILHPFGFDAKTSCDALDSLLQTRSESFVIKVPEKEDDIWKRPPPDFRPQCYEPRPPARNSRDAMQPWKYGTIPGQRKATKRHSAPARLPNILREKTEEITNFDTRFSNHGAWEAKVLCAKEGVFKPEQYRMPKPHDFRGYPSIQSLGLPEFVVDEEHDPFNLNFKSKRLDTLPGDGPTFREEREIKGLQMAPPMSPHLHWDRKLILDSLPFPNKYAAYTRYRRRDRSVHSALMDRVEERLNASWAKSQLDETLQRHRHRRPPGHTTGTIDDELPDDVEDDPVQSETC